MSKKGKVRKEQIARQESEEKHRQTIVQLQSRFQEFEQKLTQLIAWVPPIERKFTTATNDFWKAYIQIFPLLHFSDSPNLTPALEHYRAVFNLAFDKIGDAVRFTTFELQQVEQQLGLSVIDYSIYERFLTDIVDIGNNMKAALAEAIMGDLSDLQRLQKDNMSDTVRNMLDDYHAKLSTLHIAQDSRIKRHTVYLGVKAHEYERQGIASSRAIVTRIYNDLTRRRETLNDDEMSSLKWFEDEFNLDVEKAWGDSRTWYRLTNSISGFKKIVREAGYI